MRLGGGNSLSGPEPARDGAAVWTCQCRLHIRGPLHFLVILYHGAESLAALSPVAVGITGSCPPSCVERPHGCRAGPVPPCKDREEREKTLLIHEVSGRPDSHRPGPQSSTMGDAGTRDEAHLTSSCLFLLLGESAIELPPFHISSQPVCGLQEWKQGAHASLNNYFFKARKLAYSFIVKISSF